MKDYSKAIEEFEKILKKNPEADKIRYYLGILYESRDDPDAALDAFSGVPPNSSFYMESRLHMVNILRQQARNDEAEASLKQAIVEKNNVPEFYEFMAALYEEQNNYSAAEKVLENGRSVLPRSERIVFLLAIVRGEDEGQKGCNSCNARRIENKSSECGCSQLYRV